MNKRFQFILEHSKGQQYQVVHGQNDQEVDCKLRSAQNGSKLDSVIIHDLLR